MIKNFVQLGWKGLRANSKGALSGGSSLTVFEKMKTLGVASLGILGTTAILKSASTSKRRNQNLKYRTSSKMRGF